MNPLKNIALWFFFAAMVSAISIGCATGPETKSNSDKSHESEDTMLEESGYF